MSLGLCSSEASEHVLNYLNTAAIDAIAARDAKLALDYQIAGRIVELASWGRHADPYVQAYHEHVITHELPAEVDGRTAAEWLEAAIGYLEYRYGRRWRKARHRNEEEYVLYIAATNFLSQISGAPAIVTSLPVPPFEPKTNLQLVKAAGAATGSVAPAAREAAA